MIQHPITVPLAIPVKFIICTEVFWSKYCLHFHVQSFVRSLLRGPTLSRWARAQMSKSFVWEKDQVIFFYYHNHHHKCGGGVIMALNSFSKVIAHSLCWLFDVRDISVVVRKHLGHASFRPSCTHVIGDP